MGIALFFMAILGLLIYAYIRSNYKKTDGMYCTSCGYNGKVSGKPRGNGYVELLLWLCFLVPGLIYSAWRGGKKEYICPSCNGNNIIPENSPVAKDIIEKKSLTKCPFCAELIKPEAIICKHCGKEITKTA